MNPPGSKNKYAMKIQKVKAGMGNLADEFEHTKNCKHPNFVEWQGKIHSEVGAT